MPLCASSRGGLQLTTLTITNYAGTVLPATSISVTRGEPLTVTVTALTAGGLARSTAGGTLSASWKRRGSYGSPVRATVAGSAGGVDTITVLADTLRLLDGSYQFDVWYSPASGDDEPLLAQSTLSVRSAVGPEGDALQYVAGPAGPTGDTGPAFSTDATPTVHGLMSAVDKMRFDVISRTYPSVLYVAFAPETIDPAHITLTDFDVDGVLTLVSGNRILVPIGDNSGIWLVDDGLTSMTRDPLFVTIPSGLVRVTGSIGQPDYIQTSADDPAHFELLYNLIRQAIGTVEPAGAGGWATVMTIPGNEITTDVLQITAKIKVVWAGGNVEVAQGAGEYLCGNPLTSPPGLSALVFVDGSPSTVVRALISGSDLLLQVKQDALGGDSYFYKVFAQSEIF